LNVSLAYLPNLCHWGYSITKYSQDLWLLMNNKRNFKQIKAMKSGVLRAKFNSRWLCLLRVPPNLQIWSSCIDVSDLSLSYVILKMLNKYLLLLCSALNTQELPDKGCELNKLIVCLVWEHNEFHLSRYLYLPMSSSLYLSVTHLALKNVYLQYRVFFYF
jgi:hypothetical protein